MKFAYFSDIFFFQFCIYIVLFKILLLYTNVQQQWGQTLSIDLQNQDTQVFNFVFNDIQQEHPSLALIINEGVIATILFDCLQWRNSFLFVYYRFTNDKSLNSWKDSGEMCPKFSSNITGIGPGWWEILCDGIFRSYSVMLRSLLDKDEQSKLLIHLGWYYKLLLINGSHLLFDCCFCSWAVLANN